MINKRYNNITDKELDKLFRDAENQLGIPEAPDNAWADFYEKNKDQLTLSDIKSGEPVNPLSKLFDVINWRKTQKAAAIIILAIVGALSIWLLGTKKDKNSSTTFVHEKKVFENKINLSDTTSNKPNISKNESDVNNTILINEYVQFPKKILLINKEDIAPSKNVSSIPDFSSIQPGLFNTPKYNMPKQIVPNSKVDKNENFLSMPDNTKQNSAISGFAQNTNLNSQTMPTLDKKSSDGKWQVGIIGGTNLSLIKSDVSGTMGLNTGVLIQRRISESRFSIESGVIYEKMTYEVKNDDFNPNGKPVNSKVSNISGTCTMIDVPVNIRYNVVQTKKRKAFVSTGVSPTIMTNQSYVYDYTDESGNLKHYDRDVSGRGKEFYTVANLSVGYEQKWNKTSIQVTPYLKIPMGEIGYGNLNLGSIGTMVSIKRDL